MGSLAMLGLPDLFLVGTGLGLTTSTLAGLGLVASPAFSIMLFTFCFAIENSSLGPVPSPSGIGLPPFETGTSLIFLDLASNPFSSFSRGAIAFFWSSALSKRGCSTHLGPVFSLESQTLLGVLSSAMVSLISFILFCTPKSAGLSSTSVSDAPLDIAVLAAAPTLPPVLLFSGDIAEAPDIPSPPCWVSVATG